MKIPTELQPLLQVLTQDESEELNAVMNTLPADDPEIQMLILENLEAVGHIFHPGESRWLDAIEGF